MMNTDQKTGFYQLVELILKHVFRDIQVENITTQTLIYKDLRLTGDDAYEFIMDYSNTFHVDLTEFNFNERFVSEGINLINGNNGKKDISVFELEKGIERGFLK